MSPLSLDDVVAATGVPADTLQSYNERGLIGLTASGGTADAFAPGDVDRVRLILHLQAEGLGLPFIERLVADGEGAADQLLELRRRVIDGLAGTGEVTTAEALVARFGDFGGVVLERAIATNLLVAREDGRIDVPSPRLLDIAERAVASGISLPAAVEVAAAVREACLTASGACLRTILDEIWVPFEEAEFPQDQVLDVARRMLHMRTLAKNVFEATLPMVLVQVFDRPFEEDLEMSRAIAERVGAAA